MLVATAGGLAAAHRRHAARRPRTRRSAPASYARGGGIPAITLGGADVTAQLGGGQLGGEDHAARHRRCRRCQAQARRVLGNAAARGFDAQGLTLFTDRQRQRAERRRHAGAGRLCRLCERNPGQSGGRGAPRRWCATAPTALPARPPAPTAFTPNPPGGPAGFTTLITRVLNYTFGADVQDGVAQPSPNVTGLGPTGTLARRLRRTGRPRRLRRRRDAARGGRTSASATGQLGTEQSRAIDAAVEALGVQRGQHRRRDGARWSSCRTPTAPTRSVLVDGAGDVDHAAMQAVQ